MMFKKLLLAVTAAAVSAVFAGCSFFDTAANLNEMKLTLDKDATSIAHVHAKVTGFYLLGVIPFFSGSTNTPGRCTMFEDTVTIPRAVGFTAKTSQARLNSQYLTNMTTVQTNQCVLFLPIFWVKTIQVSADALR